jgi:hypothetical protein
LAGLPVITVTSDVQGPAKVDLQVVSNDKIRVLDTTFIRHADAARTVELLFADIGKSGVATLAPSTIGLTPRTLRTLTPTPPPPLVEGQQQLVDCDHAPNAPGSSWGVAAQCGPGAAAAVAGTTCFFFGPETLGGGCVFGAALGAAELVLCGSGLLCGGDPNNNQTDPSWAVGP